MRVHHRRHRPHAGGPRLLLLARHAHGGQWPPSRRPSGCATRSSRPWPRKLERGAERARGAGTASVVRAGRLGRGHRPSRRRWCWPKRARRARRSRAPTRRPSARASARGAAWALALLLVLGVRGRAVRGRGDRRDRVDEVWIAHDVGPRPQPAAGRGPGRGLRLHGPGRGAHGGAGVPQGPAQVPVDARVQEPDHAGDARRSTPSSWRRTIPRGPFGAKEAGQGPLLPVIPAVANAIYRRAGRARGRGADHAGQGACRGWSSSARAEPARVGPERLPAVPVPGAARRGVGLRPARRGRSRCGRSR